MDSIFIGEKILGRISDERHKSMPQMARGCVVAETEDGEEKVFWLIPGNLQKSYRVRTNIVGDAVGVDAGPHYYLNYKGEPCFSKNSPFGNALAELKNRLGRVSFDVDDREVKFKVTASSLYQIRPAHNDACQGDIISSSKDGFDFEISLKQELEKVREFLELLDAIEPEDSEGKHQLRKRIEQAEKEQLEKKKLSRKRRRTTESIREQFLLDPEQNKVKRTNLLNSPLVINGGPGTGKTTLLIHRIQYMLDPEMERDNQFKLRLSKEDKAFVRDQRTGWIFFSPTVLLKKYLENAMAAEGLMAHDETVRTWDQQRATLKTALGFFNTETGKPFQAYSSDSPIWQLSGAKLANLTKEFYEHLHHFIAGKIEALENVNIRVMPWRKQAEAIIAGLQPGKNDMHLNRIIPALNDLKSRNERFSAKIEKEYREFTDDVAGNIQSRLSEEQRDWFTELLKERRRKQQAGSDTQEPDEEDILESFGEEEMIEGKKLELDIFKLLKRVVRNKALSTVDANTRLNKADQEVIEKLGTLLDNEKLPEIAHRSLFIRYFKPFLAGSDSYILPLLPRLYKTFRTDVLLKSPQLTIEEKGRLQTICNATPRNSRLHEDELDLLIYLALGLARLFYTTSPQTFRDSEQPVLLTYKAFMKGQVAVDEATDFTPVQLGCMYLLSHPALNSLTLSGDLMQQMTLTGIGHWEELQQILPGLKMKSLNKSYRQTPRLLHMAAALYEHRFGEHPGFFAAEPDEGNDPPPLLLIENDFGRKISWIAARIGELYNIYEKTIPNVAIFVRDNEQIEKVAKALNSEDVLARNMITAKPCLGEGEIGSAQYIRVFNINLIKGMEFESVFFLDVDEYEAGDTAILDKLIYVGISRATYYMAITLNRTFPGRLLPVKGMLVENGSWRAEVHADY